MRLALAIVPQLERSVIKARALPFALARGQALAPHPGGRLACAALLGAAAAKLSREDVELGCLHKAVALCQARLIWLPSSGFTASKCNVA